MAWFRVYDALLDNPKVQKLKPELFKALINLWCLAKRHGGTLPAKDDIAFALRVPQATAERWVLDLWEAGLLDDKDGTVRPHDWSDHQYESDNVAARVKKHRAKQKAGVTGNGDKALHETPPASVSSNDDETLHETHQNRTDSETEQKPPNPPKGDMPAIPEYLVRKTNGQIQTAFDNYNLAAAEHGLNRAEELTADRQRKLAARLAEHGIDGWNRALVRIGDQEFLKGENDRGWKLGLDFLLQPGGLNKVLEGNYERD